MTQLYVLDAGVLFSTWTKGVKDGEFLTVSGVLQEIRNKPSKTRTDMLIILEQLEEDTPDASSVKAVKMAAKETGDDRVLSDVDINLIALAHTKKSQGIQAKLVSLDMAVLNTAKHLGISTLDPSGRFKHEIIWSFKCPACNHKSNSASRDLECPICGTQMRRVVSSRKQNR